MIYAFPYLLYIYIFTVPDHTRSLHVAHDYTFSLTTPVGSRLAVPRTHTRIWLHTDMVAFWFTHTRMFTYTGSFCFIYDFVFGHTFAHFVCHDAFTTPHTWLVRSCRLHGLRLHTVIRF